MSADKRGSGPTGSCRNNNVVVNYDNNTSTAAEKHNFSMRPSSFNGDVTKF